MNRSAAPMANVVYVFDGEVGNFHYGPKHPMKPHRVSLTHSLVKSLGLDRFMTIISPEVPKQTTFLTKYHPKDFFSSLTATDDCPCFPGFEEYSVRYAAGSVLAANQLESADIAINWAGGLHHAKKYEASGFCYVNDIVLAILELLKTHKKVLYIDIDIHHGDGVEEAFYESDSVLTLSFHRFGNFFPNTGELFCNGNKRGTGYAVNVPLKQGIDDAGYLYIFKTVVRACIYTFRPTAIVLQCGGDSLRGDKLGCFNLTIHGHGECVKFVKSFGIKLLCLGGGGYTPANVSRLWAYETSILSDVAIPPTIPRNNIYYEKFAPDFSFHPEIINKFSNENTREYLDILISYILEMLSCIS